MWTSLAAVFRASSLNKRVTAFRQLINLKCDLSSDLQSFFRKFDIIARSYTDSGGTLAVLELIVIMLSCLPDEYGVVITALSMLSEEEFTSDRVRQCLIEEEARRKNREPSSISTETVSGAAFKVNNAVKPIIRCFNCNQRGHKSNVCPKEKRNNRNNSNDQNSHKNDFKRRDVYLTGTDFSNKKSSNDIVEFVIDCGSTEHMVNDLSLLNNVRQFSSYPIGVAKEGQSLDISKGGTLDVQSFDNGREGIEITFTQVLFTPELKENLISISKLDELGVEFSIRNGKMVARSHNRILFQAKKIGGLYWTQFKIQKPSVNLAVNMKESNELWHRRLGHLSMNSVHKMISSGTVKGVCRKLSADLDFCDCCVKSKKTREPFTKTRPSTRRLLERVHTDVCGPFSTPTYDGYLYYVTFTDDFSHLTITYLIKKKSDVFETLKEYVETAEAHCNTRLSRLRCDNGGEYIGTDLRNYCKSKGIILEFIPAYNPELNGVSERMNRTICEKMRAMLLDSGLTDKYWGDAVKTATYLTNRSPTEALKGKTPFEIWFKRKPDISNLRVFGAQAFPHVPKEKRRGKIVPRSKECIMIGYQFDGYKLYDPEKNQIVISRSVKFNETRTPNDPVLISSVDEPEEKSPSINVEESPKCEPKTPNQISKLQTPTPKSTRKVSPVSSEISMSPSTPLTPKIPVKIVEEHTDEEFATPSAETPVVRRYPIRNRSRPLWQLSDEYDLSTHCVFLAGTLPFEAPSNYADVANHPDEAEWRVAIMDEIKSLEHNHTWTIVKKPDSVKLIDSRWIFKRKADTNGNMTKCKARLVARGYMQKQGIDFTETYAPVARLPTIRLLLSVGIKFNMLIEHLDVKTAFLNGDLNEAVFMKPPEGIFVPQGHVLKLQKSLYGLKQSPRCWNEKFHTCMSSLGFSRSSADPCLYIKISGKIFICLVLYVDDMLLVGNDSVAVNILKKQLADTFEMKEMGEVKNFMGLSIKINRDTGELTIDQSKYTSSILEKFGMDQCHPRSIPMDSILNLDKSEIPKSELPYRELLGSLMYLMIGTRPDICYAIGKLSRYQDNYDETHWNQLKAVLRYLKGTINFGLHYNCKTDEVLHGFADSDWANDQIDRRSTTGYLFKVFGNTVIWTSKKQSLVTLSSTEAEYVAACAAAQECIWLERVLKDLYITVEHPISIFEDNRGCIMIGKNPETKRSKHIDTKYHYLRELIRDGRIELKSIASKDQVADILTKPLTKVAFQKCRDEMSLKCGGVWTTLI